MPKILHAADFHLDSAFDYLPEDKAAERRREQRELLAHIAELCLSEGVELVLLAGDLFDSEKAYYESAELLRDCLGRIKVPVLIAPGNHDCFSPRSPWEAMELPENVHVFRSPTLRPLRLPGLTVWGMGFTSPGCPAVLDGEKIADEGLNILLMHADLSGDPRYNPVTPEALAATGADYAALGHIHSFSGVKRAGGTYYAYPGCPEGRGFDECGEKGVLIGRVEKGLCEMEFRPLPGRRCRIEELDISAAGDDLAGYIAGRLPEGAANDILRVVLRGETSAAIDTQALREALAGRFYYLDLRDRATLRRDLTAMAGEDSLRGIFLRSLLDAMDGADDETRDALSLALRCGVAALDGGEEPVL